VIEYSHKMSTEYSEVKPQNISNDDKFNKMADELLSNWSEYKKLDKKMKMLDVSLKKYMVDNNMTHYKNNNGSLTVISQSRQMLNRSLIEDIEQYYEDTDIKIMFKSSN
jgi:hypothetical protein